MSSLHHRKITISNALRSKQLFEPCFSGASWNRWEAVLKAAFHETLTAVQLALFKEVAGDRDPPTRRVKELVAVVGRGGGKDSTASIIAAYIAMSFDPRAAKLRPGEKVWVICIACDQSQASLAFGMVAALFETIPTLQQLVKRVGADSIELKNKVVIEVKTNSYRSVRGRGVLAVILDECSFFRDDSARYASPDIELFAALSPGLSRVPGSMAILISSAYRRTGLLYDHWR